MNRAMSCRALLTAVMVWLAAGGHSAYAEDTFEGTGIVTSLDESARTFTVGKYSYLVADGLTVSIGNVDTPLLGAMRPGAVIGFSGRINAAGEQVVESAFLSGKRVPNYAPPITIER